MAAQSQVRSAAKASSLPGKGRSSTAVPGQPSPHQNHLLDALPANDFERIEPISLPMLVMGRDDDHLQGIFRLSYDLLASSGKDATWVTWDHPLHGYIFPVVGADGAVEVDDVQERAIDGVIAFLDKHLAG